MDTFIEIKVYAYILLGMGLWVLDWLDHSLSLLKPLPHYR